MTFAELAAQLSADPNVRGRQFEHVARWYLTNAPEYRHQVKEVWLWNDWPERWGADKGIDIVVETHSGELWAVQAKAPTDPEHSITKREIDSFLSESNRPEFSYRLLIATCHDVSGNAYSTIVGQEKPVGLCMRSRLESANVAWPTDLSELPPTSPQPAHERRQHQVEAANAVIGGFRDHRRGQLIMACGTGKTVVGLWVSEDLDSERTLVLVPSLTLLSQTLGQWTANASRPFNYLAVCSDETVTERDAMVSHTADVGLPVTTDVTAIARFLREDGNRVVFATYQSSLRIAEAQDEGTPDFDLVDRR